MKTFLKIIIGIVVSALALNIHAANPTLAGTNAFTGPNFFNQNAYFSYPVVSNNPVSDNATLSFIDSLGNYANMTYDSSPSGITGYPWQIGTDDTVDGGGVLEGGLWIGNFTNSTYSGTASILGGSVSNVSIRALPGANLPAAIITNSAQLSGILRNQGIQSIFIAGDSQTVHAWGAGGGENYGGRTNSTTPSAATNQPDGGILYTTQPFSDTNNSWALVLTNMLGLSNSPASLDTSMSFSGEKFGNIWGGYASSNCDLIPQDFRNKVYLSNGTTNIISGIGSISVQATWYPSNKDVSISFSNDAGVYTTFVNTNNIPITFQNPTSFKTLFCTGSPNAHISFYVTQPFFAGYNEVSVPPYTNNGVYNNTTNNIPPGYWIDSNSPAITGKRSALFILCGNNDIANGTLQTTNHVHWMETNKISYFTHAKSLGFKTYLITTPLNPNINGANLNMWHVMHADETNTPSSVCDGIVDLYGILQATGQSANTGNYMDGTHWNLSFSSTVVPVIVFTNLDYQDLVPSVFFSGNYTGTFTGNINSQTNSAPISLLISSLQPNVIYSTGAYRGFAQGALVTIPSVGASASMTCFYTNNGVSSFIPDSSPAGVANPDIKPFSLMLSTNSSFSFVTNSTGTVSYPTNINLYLF